MMIPGQVALLCCRIDDTTFLSLKIKLLVSPTVSLYPILSSPSIPIHFIIRCLCVLFLIHQSIDIVCGAFEWEVGDENK